MDIDATSAACSKIVQKELKKHRVWSSSRDESKDFIYSRDDPKIAKVTALSGLQWTMRHQQIIWPFRHALKVAEDGKGNIVVVPI